MIILDYISLYLPFFKKKKKKIVYHGAYSEIKNENNWKQLKILDVTSRDCYTSIWDVMIVGLILQDCVYMSCTDRGSWQIASFGSQIQTIKASTMSDWLHVVMRVVSYSVLHIHLQISGLRCLPNQIDIAIWIILSFCFI